MSRQSSSRNYRNKKLRPRHSFHVFLLFAVGIWIVYQLTSSYGKRRVVVVETDDGNAMDGGEAAVRRRLGRKGFVGLAGHASDAGIVGVDVGGQGAGWGAASSDDPLSKAENREGDGDGDEEDQEADKDDGADDSDDGLAGDEEDDDRDLLLSQNGDSEDEMKTLLGKSDRTTLFGNGDTRFHEPKELNRSAVPPRAKATARVQDAAASQQTNATDDAADGRAIAGDAATAEKLDNRMSNRKETAASVCRARNLELRMPRHYPAKLDSSCSSAQKETRPADN